MLIARNNPGHVGQIEDLAMMGYVVQVGLGSLDWLALMNMLFV